MLAFSAARVGIEVGRGDRHRADVPVGPDLDVATEPLGVDGRADGSGGPLEHLGLLRPERDDLGVGRRAPARVAGVLDEQHVGCLVVVDESRRRRDVHDRQRGDHEPGDQPPPSTRDLRVRERLHLGRAPERDHRRRPRGGFDVGDRELVEQLTHLVIMAARGQQAEFIDRAVQAIAADGDRDQAGDGRVIRGMCLLVDVLQLLGEFLTWAGPDEFDRGSRHRRLVPRAGSCVRRARGR